MNKCPALLLTCLLVLSTILATGASADPDGDRVRVTPMFGILVPDATLPWNSIESTEIYGGSVGVKVNRWFGINAIVGYAATSGDFGIGEDGSGGFVFGEGFGKSVDILHFGMDLSFHPLQGRLDPWVSAGISLVRYDYSFDSTGFKNWLSANGAEFDLADLERVARQGKAKREAATVAAWRILDDEIAAFGQRRAERGAGPSVTALRRRFEALRAEVLAESRGGADEATRLLLSRLLHDPSEALRQAAAETENTGVDLDAALRRLFRLDEGGLDGGGEDNR